MSSTKNLSVTLETLPSTWTDFFEHGIKSYFACELPDAEDCPICTEALYMQSPGDESEDCPQAGFYQRRVAKTNVCNHVFHKHCLTTWLELSHTCPMCRAPLMGTNASSELGPVLRYLVRFHDEEGEVIYYEMSHVIDALEMEGDGSPERAQVLGGDLVRMHVTYRPDGTYVHPDLEADTMELTLADLLDGHHEMKTLWGPVSSRHSFLPIQCFARS
jgi:hypothetical protein